MWKGNKIPRARIQEFPAPSPQTANMAVGALRSGGVRKGSNPYNGLVFGGRIPSAQWQLELMKVPCFLKPEDMVGGSQTAENSSYSQGGGGGSGTVPRTSASPPMSFVSLPRPSSFPLGCSSGL